jgi:hypothetical protein
MGSAWASVDRPWEYAVRGYKPVRPEEVEQLPGGTYTPEKKDFGVYWEVEKGPTVRMGQHLLMAIPRAQKEEREAREARQSRAFVPNKSDPKDRGTELGNLQDEGLKTVADELKG